MLHRTWWNAVCFYLDGNDSDSIYCIDLTVDIQLDVDTDVDIRHISSDELIRDIDNRDSVRP